MIEIEREEENKLRKQVWKFLIIEFNDLKQKIVLDQYVIQEKETTRHKFRNKKYYSRLNQLNSSIKKDDLLIPEDVLQELKNILKIKVDDVVGKINDR